MISPMPLTHMPVASFASQPSACLGVCLLCLCCCKLPCFGHLHAWFCRLCFLNTIVTISSTFSKINSFTAAGFPCCGWCCLLLILILVGNAMSDSMLAEEATELLVVIFGTVTGDPIIFFRPNICWARIFLGILPNGQGQGQARRQAARQSNPRLQKPAR